MNKRYQVFISSTYEDLKEERSAVIQALLASDYIPAGMELFPASNENQWSLIKNVINECDYYILIIGGRYGSTNKEGKSYTQLEYEYAKEIGKPLAAFIFDKPEILPDEKTPWEKGDHPQNTPKNPAGGKKIQQNIVYCCNVTKEPLDEVKEESEKADLKFSIQETKIMASSLIISWQIDGEKKCQQ